VVFCVLINVPNHVLVATVTVGRSESGFPLTWWYSHCILGRRVLLFPILILPLLVLVNRRVEYSLEPHSHVLLAVAVVRVH
jgi:hypothetical protein